MSHFKGKTEQNVHVHVISDTTASIESIKTLIEQLSVSLTNESNTDELNHLNVAVEKIKHELKTLTEKIVSPPT